MKAAMRVTREGKLFLLLALGVGFAALNTGNNLLYLVLALQASIFIIQLVIGELNIRNIQITRDAPYRVSVGQIFPVTLNVTNRNRFLSIFSIQLRDIIDGAPFKRSCYFLKTDVQETRNIEYWGEFDQRGEKQFTHVQLSSAFPFGFTERTKRIALAHRLVAWPAKIPVHLPRLHERHGLTALSIPQKGMGDEFWQMRAFHPGDDIKKISWKATAKLNQLMVIDNQSQTDRTADIWLSFQSTDSAPTTDPEQLIRITASVLHGLHLRGVTTWLNTPTRTGIPGPPSAPWAQLDHLALLDATKTASSSRSPSRRACALIINSAMAQRLSVPPGPASVEEAPQ